MGRRIKAQSHRVALAANARAARHPKSSLHAPNGILNHMLRNGILNTIEWFNLHFEPHAPKWHFESHAS
jgi:hypothetical protein